MQPQRRRDAEVGSEENSDFILSVSSLRLSLRLGVSAVAFGSTCLYAPIAHAHAERQRELLDLAEPGRGHHAGHLLPADEGVDRLREVFVRAGLVAADEGGGAGEDRAEVEVVEAAQEGVSGKGELEDDEAPAGAEDPVELGD